MGTVRAFPAFYSPVGFQKLSVTTGSAVALTVPTTVQVRAVIMSIEYATSDTDKLRFRVDGSDPDATNGMILGDRDILELTNVTMITNFRAIALTNNMVAQVTYFGGGV